MALTTAINASSTLTRCLADVSIHWALNRFARSRPSVHQPALFDDDRKGARTMRLDLTLILQITLVGNNNNGEEILVLHLFESAFFLKSEYHEQTHPEDLLMERPNLLKRTTRRDRVNQ
jgi:hypothetical protein